MLYIQYLCNYNNFLPHHSFEFFLSYQSAKVTMIPSNCPDYRLGCYLSKLYVHLYKR